MGIVSYCFHSHSGQSHGCFLFSLTKLLNWCRWPLLQPGLYSCESARRKENSWVATLTVLTRNFKRNELCRHVSTPQLPQPSASTLPKLTLDAGFPLPARVLSMGHTGGAMARRCNPLNQRRHKKIRRLLGHHLVVPGDLGAEALLVHDVGAVSFDVGEERHFVGDGFLMFSPRGRRPSGPRGPAGRRIYLYPKALLAVLHEQHPPMCGGFSVSIWNFENRNAKLETNKNLHAETSTHQNRNTEDSKHQ